MSSLIKIYSLPMLRMRVRPQVEGSRRKLFRPIWTDKSPFPEIVVPDPRTDENAPAQQML